MSQRGFALPSVSNDRNDSDFGSKVVDGNSVRRSRILLLPFHRALVVSLILVFAALIVAVLKVTISQRFAYEGYGYFPIDQFGLFIWTWGLVVLPAFFLPIKVSKPSQFLSWILMLVVYIPSILVPPYTLGFRWEYAPYQGVLFACMAMLCGVGHLPAVRIPAVKWSMRAYVAGLLVYSIVIMGWIILQVGVPTSVPSFATVYEQRAAYNAAMVSPGPLAYLIAWQTSVVNPLLLLIGLARKKWMIVGIGLGLNLLMYSLAGHKSHLLSSVLVVGVYILMGLASQWRGILVSAGAMIIVTASWLMYLIADFIYPVSIFVRRMIVVPGLLTGYYFEYFSDVGFTHRFGPLSMLFSSVEMEFSTPNTIGQNYFNNPNTAANANFWADGFSAFGIPGVLLATVLLVALLYFMDSLSVARPPRVATPLFLIAMYSLTNSALPTSLLTHGILITVIVILLYPTEHSKAPRQTTSIDLSSTQVSKA